MRTRNGYMIPAMKNVSALALLIAATGLCSSASVLADGPLNTLPQGVYQCSLPGDATQQAWKVLDGSGFMIEGASQYRSTAGSGTYLLKGKDLVFTRGPKKGVRMIRLGERRLRLLNGDGSESATLCVRISPLPD